jgi:LysR family hydrogen peroxide-inducible transcriptional activator
MNLQQLEYIVALDRLKSFSKAAEACHITQATLSTMVKRLEEELDIVIFDRKASPILTTECGKELIEEARIILTHRQNIQQLAATLKGKVEGELKIGIIPTIAGNLLHRVIPSFLIQFPHLHLHLFELTTDTILQQLKTGELDAGIVSTPLQQEEMEEAILYYERLKVYGISSKNKEYVLPEELASEKIWLLEEGNCLRDQFINLCAINPKKMNSNLNFQPNSFESLLNFVDHFSGLTLLPELYYLDLPLDKKEKTIDFAAPYPVREVSLIYYRPYAKLRLVNALAEEIKRIIPPMLETATIHNSELQIVQI